jgi:cation diffusion facilitator CzcD-associated flavoprotein CzcO
MLKAMREYGFDATLFERRERVGGLWAYTDDKRWTTALRSEYLDSDLLRHLRSRSAA